MFGVALSHLEWLIALFVLMGVAKSGLNGSLHRLYSIVKRVDEELDRLETIKEKTINNQEEIRRTRQDIHDVKHDVKTLSGAVQAQILFENGDLDRERLLEDLDPDEGNVSRYVNRRSSDD